MRAGGPGQRPARAGGRNSSWAPARGPMGEGGGSGGPAPPSRGGHTATHSELRWGPVAWGRGRGARGAPRAHDIARPPQAGGAGCWPSRPTPGTMGGPPPHRSARGAEMGGRGRRGGQMGPPNDGVFCPTHPAAPRPPATPHGAKKPQEAAWGGRRRGWRRGWGPITHLAGCSVGSAGALGGHSRSPPGRQCRPGAGARSRRPLPLGRPSRPSPFGRHEKQGTLQSGRAAVVPCARARGEGRVGGGRGGTDEAHRTRRKKPTMQSVAHL